MPRSQSIEYSRESSAIQRRISILHEATKNLDIAINGEEYKDPYDAIIPLSNASTEANLHAALNIRQEADIEEIRRRIQEIDLDRGLN
jgi:hypothetical protein